MDLKNTISLEDAQRINGPLAFNIMVKPVGSLCNLDCNYCYYLDKAEIYGGKEPLMSLETLERFTKSYIEANEVPEVCFNWHGGEPLLAGLDFYKKAIEFQKKYSNGKTVHNTIQTNATLINPEWASFFRENNFLVGVSIDGPKEIHDRYRKDKGRKPSFDRVIAGIECLYKRNVEYNTMTTVNKASESNGLLIYSFLKSIGSRFMQFMPVVEHVVYIKHDCSDGRGEVSKGKNARPFIVPPSYKNAVLAPWSVSAIAFGKFLNEIFDHWVKNDVGRYYVNYFDNTLANWCGAQPGTCAFAEVCGGNSIIEHNGDIYPCDHFVYPEYFLGNIKDIDLKSIMTGCKQIDFGLSKRNGLPKKCLACKWWFACKGECPKHRFNKTERGETGLSALCEGYQMFYNHVAPYMEFMKNQLVQKQSPAAVMAWARLKK